LPAALELRPEQVGSDGSNGLVVPRLDARPDADRAPDCEQPPAGIPKAYCHLRWVAGRESQPALIEPLSPARYRVQFTASAELRDKLERLRALMRSSVPDGDLAAIIEAAVTEKLERLEARRFGKTKAPRREVPAKDGATSSRHVPAAIRRAVHERDGGRCRYVDDQGRRCTARARLELHHRHPFAVGGGHSPTNVSLLCKVHNQYLAQIDFGGKASGRQRRSGAGLADPGPEPETLSATLSSPPTGALPGRERGSFQRHSRISGDEPVAGRHEARRRALQGAGSARPPAPAAP
jgi:hypothetical protein